MADRPLVSLITPTWQRHDLLLEAIENVRSQTYRPLEHIIVSDGPDPDLLELIADSENEHNILTDGERFVPIVFQELGRNWSTFLPDSFCAAPATVGMLLARGEYQCAWADDERAEPEHVTKLVALIESTGADFVYPRVEMQWKERTDQTWVIGTDPPRYGQITHWLYRADLLRRGLYPFGEGMASDWACIQQWMQRGATWAFLPEVTFRHRADH